MEGAAHVTTTRGVASDGYTCPDFIFSRRVEPRMDVFSLAVVTLEALTGSPAVEPGGDAGAGTLPDRLFARLGAGVPLEALLDPSAAWPPAAARELVALVLTCLCVRPKSWERRPDAPERPSISTVLAELTRIRGQHVLGTGLPAAAMSAEAAGDALGAAPSAPTVVMTTCCVCREPKPVVEGLFCDPLFEPAPGKAPPPDGTHFVCGGAEPCLETYLRVQCEQGAGRGVDAEGCLRCPGACPRELKAQHFGPKVSEVAFDLFQAALTRRTTRLALADHRAELEAERARLRVALEAELRAEHGAALAAAQMAAAQAAVRHVQVELLTLYCPNGHAFVDFEGCFSLQCVTCNIYFCAWCLGGASRSSGASHQHVSACASNVNRRSADYFGTMVQFNSAHRARRQAAVTGYLRGLSEEVRPLAARLLVRDVADLGIMLKADVTAGGENAAAVMAAAAAAEAAAQQRAAGDAAAAVARRAAAVAEASEAARRREEEATRRRAAEAAQRRAAEAAAAADAARRREEEAATAAAEAQRLAEEAAASEARVRDAQQSLLNEGPAPLCVPRGPSPGEALTVLLLQVDAAAAELARLKTAAADADDFDAAMQFKSDATDFARAAVGLRRVAADVIEWAALKAAAAADRDYEMADALKWALDAVRARSIASAALPRGQMLAGALNMLMVAPMPPDRRGAGGAGGAGGAPPGPRAPVRRTVVPGAAPVVPPLVGGDALPPGPLSALGARLAAAIADSDFAALELAAADAELFEEAARYARKHNVNIKLR